MNSTKNMKGLCKNQADASDDAIGQLAVKKW